jgi:uncharacterized protein DUF1016
VADESLECVRDYAALVSAITQTHDRAQRQAAQAVNVALTLRNWLIGYYLVEYEQHGNDRAQYGARLLEKLARDLQRRVGRGFTKRSLELFRLFYMRYSIAKILFSQSNPSLTEIPGISPPPFDWQDDAYFERLFRSRIH